MPSNLFLLLFVLQNIIVPIQIIAEIQSQCQTIWISDEAPSFGRNTELYSFGVGMRSIIFQRIELDLSLFFICCGCPSSWGRQQVATTSNT